MERRVAGTALALASVGMLVSAPARLIGAGPVVAVTAGYQMTTLGELRTVEITAQRDAANNTRGQGHLFNHVSGTKLHFTIDCLSVVGNVATISGQITHSDNLVFPEATPIWLRVVDNGEGRKSPRDLVAPLVAFPGGAGVPCTSPVLDANIPIEGGNIQVR
jgi:hypothetical protein